MAGNTVIPCSMWVPVAVRFLQTDIFWLLTYQFVGCLWKILNGLSYLLHCLETLTIKETHFGNCDVCYFSFMLALEPSFYISFLPLLPILTLFFFVVLNSLWCAESGMLLRNYKSPCCVTLHFTMPQACWMTEWGKNWCAYVQVTQRRNRMLVINVTSWQHMKMALQSTSTMYTRQTTSCLNASSARSSCALRERTSNTLVDISTNARRSVKFVRKHSLVSVFCIYLLVYSSVVVQFS